MSEVSKQESAGQMRLWSRGRGKPLPYRLGRDKLAEDWDFG